MLLGRSWNISSERLKRLVNCVAFFLFFNVWAIKIFKIVCKSKSIRLISSLGRVNTVWRWWPVSTFRHKVSEIILISSLPLSVALSDHHYLRFDGLFNLTNRDTIYFSFLYFYWHRLFIKPGLSLLELI